MAGQTLYGVKEGYTFGPFKPNAKYFDPANGAASGTWTPSNNNRNSSFGSYTGGFDGASSIGGVSAVNPQGGQANELDSFKRYEDMAFNNSMARLEPQFDRQNADFNQGMVSRGLPVGSDAYNSSQANLAQAQAGATQDAALGAMQFGLGAQNQSFQQDATRSGLANALLQSRWSTDLGWANNALGNRQLDQQGQQFNDKLGFDYDTFFDTLGQRNYEFDTTMDQNQYQFDAGQDFNYWDRGNQFDYMYDRANASDYFGSYDRNQQSRQYDDALFLSLFGQPAPGVSGQNAGGIYGQQIGNATRPGFDLLTGLGFL
jgi:hypothetical protein